MYKLKTKPDGTVEGLYKAGSHYVRVFLPLEDAQKICTEAEKNGTISNANLLGYSINVADTWHFDGEVVIDSPKPKRGKKDA